MEDIRTTVDSITISWTTSPTVTSTVVSWEVIHDSDSTPRAVRHADNGSSELLIGINTYTIEGLLSDTEYDITITVINAAGNTTTGFTHSTVEGNSENIIKQAALIDYLYCYTESSEADNTAAAIIGGVIVAIVLIISITTAVTVILLVRNCRRSYSTQKRLVVHHYHHMTI